MNYDARYDTLEDFINIRKNCIFCGGSLTPIMTNLDGSKGIPDICAPLHGDKFQFKLKYDGERCNFDVNISIDIKSNRFSFFYYGASSATHNDVVRVFMGINPYIELTCSNDDCEFGYYLHSDTVRLNAEHYVKSLPLLWEAFELGDWWVCNHYDSHYPSTQVFSRNNPDSLPLAIPRIDFETTSQDKLIQKIKTFVTFS